MLTAVDMLHDDRTSTTTSGRPCAAHLDAQASIELCCSSGTTRCWPRRSPPCASNPTSGGGCSDTLPARLPRGRHGLTRAEVESSQRDRLLDAMADAMSEQGYVATPVADVIKRAGVSRESFYELFSSKLDCFMSAFDIAG